MTGTSGIPDVWIDAIMNRAYTDTAPESIPSQFKIGRGTTDFDPSDTDLEDPVPITGTEEVDNCDATTGWAAGTDSAITLNTSTFVEGTGSLSLAKPGTTGTSASMSKTTTSRDFTDKTFVLFILITDLADLVASGTALSVRFGSDSSNYFQLDVDISNLTTGFNFIAFTSATATSTTGAPVIAAMDFTEVIVNTDLAADTIAADRILFDDMKLASADDFFKDLEAGFPSVDIAKDEVTMEGRVNTLEANGVLITEWATVNSDGTPVLVSRSTFNPFSKTLNDELIGSERVRHTR